MCVCVFTFFPALIKQPCHRFSLTLALCLQIANKYGVTRIKLIGDAYIAVAGLPTASGVTIEPADHAVSCVKFAVEVLEQLAQFNRINHEDIHIRIGVHTGPLVTAVLGKSKSFEMYGEALERAVKMEETSAPDRVHLTPAVYNLVSSSVPTESCV